MSKQDKYSILFLLLFIAVGVGAIYLMPERTDRQKEWNKQTARAIPPTAGKTTQHQDSAPAKAYDNTGSADRLRPEDTNTVRPLRRKDAKRIEAQPGASGWLTEKEKEKAMGKIWNLDVNGLQNAFAQHRPELAKCYSNWKEENPEAPGNFTLQLEVETLFGEPFAVVQKAKISKSGFNTKTMELCVRNILAAVLFKPPAGDRMTVRIPMNFDQMSAQSAKVQ